MLICYLMILGNTLIQLGLLCLFLVLLQTNSAIFNHQLSSRKANSSQISTISGKNKKKVFKARSSYGYIFYEVEYKIKDNENQILVNQNIPSHQILSLQDNEKSIDTINQNSNQINSTNSTKTNNKQQDHDTQIKNLKADSLAQYPLILSETLDKSATLSIEPDMKSNDKNNQFLGYYPKVTYKISKKQDKNTDQILQIKECVWKAHINMTEDQISQCLQLKNTNITQQANKIKQKYPEQPKQTQNQSQTFEEEQQNKQGYYIVQQIDTNFHTVKQVVSKVNGYSIRLSTKTRSKYWSPTQMINSQSIKITEITQYSVQTIGPRYSLRAYKLSKKQAELMIEFYQIPDIIQLKYLVMSAQIISNKILETIQTISQETIQTAPQISPTFMYGEPVQFI